MPLSSQNEKKVAARLEIKNRLAFLGQEDFMAAGLKAALFFRSSSFWDKYKTFLLFMSTKTEIDTAPLLLSALDGGKIVFAPCVESGKMNFYRVKSPSGPWSRGAFGIREPLPHEEGRLKKTDFPALIFTPGLAFDREGNRLGRGRGYYDNFFDALEKSGLDYFPAGICLKSQVLPFIPVEKWDRPVRFVGSF